MFIKDIVLVFVIVLTAQCANGKKFERSKRAAYELPSGTDLLIGSVSTSFQCTSDGYYADVDNGCQLFHVCNTAQYPDGRTEMQQHTFICGNQTVFNQLTFTCDFPEEAVPCSNAQDFFYLNERIGDPKALFHTENDIERAAPLIASGRGGLYQERIVPQIRTVPETQTTVPIRSPIPQLRSPNLTGRRPPSARRPSGRKPIRRN